MTHTNRPNSKIAIGLIIIILIIIIGSIVAFTTKNKVLIAVGIPPSTISTRLLKTLPDNFQPSSTSYFSAVMSVAFSPDGKPLSGTASEGGAISL